MYPFESRANRSTDKSRVISKEENLLCSAKLSAVCRRSEIRQSSISTDSGITQANAIFIQHSFRKWAGTNLKNSSPLPTPGFSPWRCLLSLAPPADRNQTRNHRHHLARKSRRRLLHQQEPPRSHRQGPGADKAKFDAAVKNAETGCPVSKLFKAENLVSARLES